ncbi:hypothetical protein FHS57_001016 [Runella defluvii]|uniref:Uncharacterized protein n=1 Tax=Runella defluvii TaxID=370973 RepID=A0A7W5ZGQ6_9BACT|nr:hypothetical protein [Runella defluvii]MBB3837022.1 hypothetical protein [Runella defluvii]
MKFKDFEFTEDNHFVAMEYYNLILNRTYLVVIVKDKLLGIKVNGLVSVEGGGDILTKKVTKMMAIEGDLSNPYSYLSAKYVDKIQECELESEEVLAYDKSNFILPLAHIKKVYHDPKNKWGMGYYPHDGKVYVETSDKKKKEFIILGSQSGSKIANFILGKLKGG